MSHTEHLCPVQETLAVIGGKWKLPILWQLSGHTLRYHELQERIGAITPKMLAQELRELEQDGIVVRKVYPVVPPKVEYALTPYGKTLQPLLDVLGKWGKKHRARNARVTHVSTGVVSGQKTRI